MDNAELFSPRNVHLSKPISGILSDLEIKGIIVRDPQGRVALKA